MKNGYESITAIVSSDATLGSNVKVWDFAHVRERAEIGANTIIGRNVYVGAGVRIGANCKIQNDSQVYEPAVLEDGVFLGPGVTLTNDRSPRAVLPNGRQKSIEDWVPVGVVVQLGASIGAGSVCVGPVIIGAWSMVGAGSVVTKDVKPYALVLGNPARQIDWVGRSGSRLLRFPGGYCCPVTNERYREVNGNLESI